MAMTRITVPSRTGKSASWSIAPTSRSSASGRTASRQRAGSLARGSMTSCLVGRRGPVLEAPTALSRLISYAGTMPAEVRYRTCPLCEATCGLEITVADGAVQRVRGDAEDVFSHGFLCPKGVGIKELHEDPDRIRTPLLRRGDGFVEASWDEAFAAIDEGLGRVLGDGDRNAVGVYFGNPTAHNLSAMLYGRVLMKAFGTRNLFSASTVDQFPKQLASSYMFGSAVTVPVPDLDRCEWLLVLGANPVASNGSLMTAPDVRGRLKGIQRRGGRIVVVDPRRSRTAEMADEHVPIRPGTDALLLFAMVHVLFAEGVADLGHVAPYADGVEAVEELARPFS